MVNTTVLFGIEASIVALWVIVLVPICYNIYHYLVRERKYKFIPMLLVYVGQLSMVLIILAYFITKETDGNKRQMEQWSYFTINMRLACLICILGFSGLVIELSLKLKMLQQTSAQLAFNQRKRISGPLPASKTKLALQTIRSESTLSDVESGLAFDVNDSHLRSSLSSALSVD